jgi:hypothetical protein
MKTFKQTLFEELSEKQKDRVDSWGRSQAATNISQHVIPKGQHRIVIPLSDPKDKAAEPNVHVNRHLEQHGYKVTDWTSGKASDKYGRETNIGKVLDKTKADPEIKHWFHHDHERTNARTHNDMQVVISRHPYDVAGMSTNRDWTSCVDMKTGPLADTINNTHYLEHEVREGTHVAYLTKKGDDYADKPLARIALKPYKEEGSDRVVLHPEHKIYGNAASSFEHTVNDWTNQHFPLKDNTFYDKNLKVYDDSHTGGLGHSIAKVNTLSDDKLKSTFKKPETMRIFPESYINRAKFVARTGSDSQRDVLVNHPDSYVRAIVAEHGNESHHNKLIDDNSGSVRKAIAQNTYSAAHLDTLSDKWESSDVREVAQDRKRALRFHGELKL